MLTTQNNPWVKDFPILAADENGNRLVYLDSAATTQHPTLMVDARFAPAIDKIPLESLQDEVRENVAGRLNDELDG